MCGIQSFGVFIVLEPNKLLKNITPVIENTMAFGVTVTFIIFVLTHLEICAPKNPNRNFGESNQCNCKSVAKAETLKTLM